MKSEWRVLDYSCFWKKRVGFYPLMENLTASVLSEVSGGSFIYLRELGYILRIIFQGVEENYSRGKRFRR